MEATSQDMFNERELIKTNYIPRNQQEIEKGDDTINTDDDKVTLGNRQMAKKSSKKETRILNYKLAQVRAKLILLKEKFKLTRFELEKNKRSLDMKTRLNHKLRTKHRNGTSNVAVQVMGMSSRLMNFLESDGSTHSNNNNNIWRVLSDSDLSKRKSVEEIQKVSSLASKVNQLEKQCSLLQGENKTLKVKMEVELQRERTNQSKEVQRLRRRNVELNNDVTRLHDKVKILQVEKSKIKKSSKLEKMKEERGSYQKMSSTHCQTIVIKEREVEKLRKLTVRLCHRKDEKILLNGNVFKNTEELQKMYLRSCKERLQLERHLARITVAAQQNAEVDPIRYLALVQTNQALRQRLQEVDRALLEHQDAEVRLSEKEIELSELKKELQQKQRNCSQLEAQLIQTLQYKSQVEAKSLELQKKLVDYNFEGSTECETSGTSCKTVEKQVKFAQSEVGRLQGKVNNLETLIRHMRDTAEKRKGLEREHAEALAELRKKQEEVKRLGYTGGIEKQRALDAIRSLESKVRELLKKCELENVRHEELLLEMTALKRAQAKKGWGSQRSQSADVPSESNYDYIHDVDSSLYSTPDTLLTSSHRHTNLGQFSSGLSSTASSLPSLDLLETHTLRSSSPLSFTSQKPFSVPSRSLVSKNLTGSDPLLSPMYSQPSAILSSTAPSSVLPSCKFSSHYSLSSSALDFTSHEIDKILARIEQDNRVLSELEKSRATVGSPVSSANIERLRANIEEDSKFLDDLMKPHSSLKSSFSSPAIDQLLLEPHRAKQMYWQLSRYRPPLKSSVTMRELDLLMAKLDQDNRILAELDKKRASIGLSPLSNSLFPPRHFVSSVPYTSVSSSIITNISSGSMISNTAFSSGLLSGARSGHSSLMQQLTASAIQVPVPIKDSVSSGVIGSLVESCHKLGHEVDIFGEEVIDFMDLPGRGRCKAYIARYSYDPLKQSPNENPEAELCLSAGDYVLILGDMDEDGFFSGELLDGRKGLVPSNFIEKLVGEDLFDFQTTVLYGNRDSDDSSASYTYAQDLDMPLGTEDMQVLPPEDFHRMNDYIDLEDIEEVDEDDLSDVEKDTERPVPPPQRLILERQLNKSILIGWLAPENYKKSLVDSYQVYVDGVMKATVKNSERTRALLEGVDSSQPHRVSVRSVTKSAHHSRDAACTIVIGKDIPLSPSCVKASNITSTSAVISWLPSNSNFHHVVAVNNVEVRTVKSSIFRHTITGLAPNTVYRVSVRAKPGKLLYNDEKNPRKLEMLTTYVDFRTLPKGLPDPPVDIQIEAGPQDGTLLVTWLPVTINPTGTSNGAPVTGYAVFASGKKVTEIDSPTGDHALLDISELIPLSKKSVTVRTKSGESLSSDSMSCIIPEDLWKATAKKCSKSLPQSRRKEDGGKCEKHGSESDSESDTELAELMNHVSRRARDFDPAEFSPYGFQEDELAEDGQEGSSRSELSDIIEEAEDDLADSSEPRELSRNQDKKFAHERTAHHASHAHGSSSRTAVKNPSESRHNPATSSNRKSREYSHSNRDDHVPAHRRITQIVRERRNSAGQLIIEPDENLSDKEIYPISHVPIPSIEITKDSASEGCNSLENYSEEEYELTRSSRRIPNTPYNDGHKPRNPPHHHYTHERDVHRSTSPTPPSRSLPIRDDRNCYNPRGVPPTQHGDASYGRGDSYANYHAQNHSTPPSYQDNRVRWFVALFDYDPQTMSPNPDAAEEELPFQEGQLIKIHGDKDADGFYRGEANGRMGFVPCNMVSEVQVEEEEPSHHVIGENGRSRHHSTSIPPSSGEPRSNVPMKKMIALYDYDPQELSPNVDAEMELPFSTGDILYVYGEMDEDGFYMGELNGVRGLVPSNFLTEAPPDYRDNRPPRDKLAPPTPAAINRQKVDWSRLPTRNGQPDALTSSPWIPETQPSILKVTSTNHRSSNTSPKIKVTLPDTITKTGSPQQLPEVIITREDQLNGGNTRPRTLDLCSPPTPRRAKGFPAAGPRFGLVSTSPRKNDKRGILSSVKSIFKSGKKG